MLKPSVAEPTTVASKLRKLIDMAAWRVAPRFYGNQRIKREQDFFDARDRDAFAAAQIPEGESISVPCVWIVEVYLPSHIDGLVRGLKDLNVESGNFWRGNPIESVLNSRARGGETYPTNLAHLRREPMAPRSLFGISARLPAGVYAASLDYVSPMPGVTVVIGHFYFDDEAALGISEPFRTDYRATAVRADRGWALPTGAHLRDDAVIEYRAGLRRRCERWFHDNLPGVYSTLTDAVTPACELLTFAVADPLGGRTPAKYEDQKIIPPGELTEEPESHSRGGDDEPYLSILGQTGDWDAWACADNPGLVLRLPRTHEPFHTDSHLVLSANVGTFHRIQPYADKNAEGPRAVGGRIGSFGKTFVIYAISRLIGDFENRIGRLADQLGTVPLKNVRRSVQNMTTIEREMAILARDARPCLRGVAGADERFWEREIADFVAFRKDERGERPLFQTVGQMTARSSSPATCDRG